MAVTDGVDFNQPLYLSLEVGGSGASPAWDGEMRPRKMLGSAPSAIEAGNALAFGGLATTSYLRSDATNIMGTFSRLIADYLTLGSGTGVLFGTGGDLSYIATSSLGIYGLTKFDSSVMLGQVWTPKDSNRGWSGVAMSADGCIQTAAADGDYLYVSTDYSNNWTPKGVSQLWRGIAMSADGRIQIAAAYDGDYLYVSTDFGDTWTPKDSDAHTWRSVSMSANGRIQAATDDGNAIYLSDDYGNTWTPKQSIANLSDVAISADGRIQTALVLNGAIYISTDSGVLD